jgi:glycine/D-amino acid oxidase-like deaminating enzyme
VWSLAATEADPGLRFQLSGSDSILAPALVSPEREIRTVIGLRPFRPTGFVVRAEKLGEKLVIHNYGHGGVGITLSWGTSQLAMELPIELSSSVAVIGCGAVGLATARLLQDRGLRVTIYASDLPPNTTSNIAGGQNSVKNKLPNFNLGLVSDPLSHKDTRMQAVLRLAGVKK